MLTLDGNLQRTKQKSEAFRRTPSSPTPNTNLRSELQWRRRPWAPTGSSTPSPPTSPSNPPPPPPPTPPALPSSGGSPPSPRPTASPPSPSPTPPSSKSSSRCSPPSAAPATASSSSSPTFPPPPPSPPSSSVAPAACWRRPAPPKSGSGCSTALSACSRPPTAATRGSAASGARPTGWMRALRDVDRFVAVMDGVSGGGRFLRGEEKGLGEDWFEFPWLKEKGYYSLEAFVANKLELALRLSWMNATGGKRRGGGGGKAKEGIVGVSANVFWKKKGRLDWWDRMEPHLKEKVLRVVFGKSAKTLVRIDGNFDLSVNISIFLICSFTISFISIIILNLVSALRSYV